LDAKQQFQDTGRFPPGDLSVSPISELVFQFGIFFAPLGGWAYGLAGRLLNHCFGPALLGLPGFVAWLGVFFSLSYFDGGTLALSTSREPLFLAAILLGAGALWRRLSLRFGESAASIPSAGGTAATR
jgi:hypothetical protein